MKPVVEARLSVENQLAGKVRSVEEHLKSGQGGLLGGRDA